MGGSVVGLGAAGVAAASMAWAVRGRSSRVFGPSIWHGPRVNRALALTFDDGPSPQTQELLDVLARFGIPATFFMCGMHARRLPAVARELVDAGHEPGNHTHTHAALWLRTPAGIRDEVLRAQNTITDVCGRAPLWFRPPYGVRWFGLRAALAEAGLTCAMWTVIGRDWTLPAPAVADRIIRNAFNGAILCLHDGRELERSPDIRATISAVREFVPRLLDSGYRFCTVSGLIGYSGSVCPTTSPSG